MSLLKKKVMFWDVLCACVFLHSSPSFYKSVECALVVKPQNVAAVSGEKVVLNCTSDVSKNNIAWSTVSPGSSDRKTIYIGNELAERVSSYISVSDEIDGSCNLRINTSVEAAKRYICADRTTGDEASAELVIFNNHALCDYDNQTSVVTCVAMFAGGWAPDLQCKQWNEAKKILDNLEGNMTAAVNNSVETRTWKYANKNFLYDIYCFVKFEVSKRPKETTATNILTYEHEVPGYRCTEKKQPVETHTTVAPGSFQALLIGLIVSGITNVVLVAVVIVSRNKLRKRHGAIVAKENFDEEIHFHGGQVSKA